MFRYFENLIDPYCDYPFEDRPPTKLWAFLRGYARPFNKLFVVTALLTTCVAFVEIWLISYVGRLVDMLSNTEPGVFWRENGLEMALIAVFLLVFRPILQMVDVGLLYATGCPRRKAQAGQRSG